MIWAYFLFILDSLLAILLLGMVLLLQLLSPYPFLYNKEQIRNAKSPPRANVDSFQDGSQSTSDLYARDKRTEAKAKGYTNKIMSTHK